MGTHTAVASFWQLLSCAMPRAQPLQHVVKGRPLPSLPGATLSPHPFLQRPGPTFEASICPQSRSWPKPMTQPRQQVVNGLLARVTPGHILRPQPTRQKPSGTSRSPPPSWSACSRSLQALPPSVCMDSLRILACSSSIHEKAQRYFAQSTFSLLSMPRSRCLVWATRRSTWRAKQTSPCICASLYFMLPTFPESPSSAASAEFATFKVSTSSASLYSLRTWA
mmetsp:Transcript_80367/g.179943  ORF Transcript_80367/g.179943 Transcript_80367/m.179943 type:complete len:223 (-) Transcript_80367:501-1169(-)